MSESTTTSITCRAAVPDDAAAVARVHDASRRHAYAGLLTEAQLNAMTLEERTKFWRDRIVLAGQSDFRVFVANSDAEVCGFVCVESNRARNVAEIDRIYVLPAWFGQGVGRALMTCALDYLRDYGFEKVRLWAFCDNAPAHAFYVKVGFKLDGAERKWPSMPKEVRFARGIEPW